MQVVIYRNEVCAYAVSTHGQPVSIFGMRMLISAFGQPLSEDTEMTRHPRFRSKDISSRNPQSEYAMNRATSPSKDFLSRYGFSWDKPGTAEAIPNLDMVWQRASAEKLSEP